MDYIGLNPKLSQIKYTVNNVYYLVYKCVYLALDKRKVLKNNRMMKCISFEENKSMHQKGKKAVYNFIYPLSHTIIIMNKEI